MSLILLPHPHLAASARTFDNGELLRQVDLARAALIELNAGKHYKARTLMWLGYRLGLTDYLNRLIIEAMARGYATSPYVEIPKNMERHIRLPPWFGDERVHISHQALLLRKNPSFYGRYNWGVLPTFPVLHPASFVYTQKRVHKTCDFDFGRFE